MSPWWPMFLVVVGSTTLQGAPFTTINPEVDQKGINTKLDSSVEELEKLKIGAEHPGETSALPHLEDHNTDVVKQSGVVVPLVERQSAVSGPPPVLLPHSEGPRGSEQDGDITHTTTPATDTTTKVFHGAARLVQPGAASQPVQRPAHLTVRRSNSRTELQAGQYAGADGVWSPVEVARYVYYTGDQRRVTDTIQEYIRRGLMSKEEAISFLQEIKFNVEYLKAHSADRMSDDHRQLPIRNMMFEQPHVKDTSQYRYPLVMGTSFKRASADPMLENNLIGTSEFDKDPPAITSEEYEEMMDRLKIADSLYTEYTLEEIIYELAKMMFSMSLSRDRTEPVGVDRTQAGLQRFMALLQTEADRGRISTRTQKDITDVMMAALSDVLGDHPELTQSHISLTQPHTPTNRLLSRLLEESDPAMSRAVLSAFREEFPKQAHNTYRYMYPETN